MPLDANFFPQYRELLHGQAVERSLLFAATLLSLENCQGGDSNPYGFLHQILSLARLPISPPWHPENLTKPCSLYARAALPQSYHARMPPIAEYSELYFM